tara:strand:- start:2 stop:727 length:726 start_codon:yes stop_codon:yes gene_type:complete
MDLIISGNITKDTLYHIYDNFFKEIKIGGIMNAWSHFQYINKRGYTIDLQPLSYGESIILIDKKYCERYNRSELNIIHNIPNKIVKTKWYHLMYINQLTEYNEQFLKNINSKILSCDICGGVDNLFFDIALLKFFDFVFLSEDDIYGEITLDDIKEKVKGYLIIHSSKNCKILNNKMENPIELKVNINKILSNINVLGAGDYFAASFIYYMMNNCVTDISNIQDAIKFSQNSLYEKFIKYK